MPRKRTQSKRGKNKASKSSTSKTKSYLDTAEELIDSIFDFCSESVTNLYSKLNHNGSWKKWMYSIANSFGVAACTVLFVFIIYLPLTTQYWAHPASPRSAPQMQSGFVPQFIISSVPLMNPLKYIFMNDGESTIIRDFYETESGGANHATFNANHNNNNEHHHSNQNHHIHRHPNQQSNHNNNNNNNHQFCRIQTSPAPSFESKTFIELQGCRIVPSQEHTTAQPNVQMMSNEERDINEIMSQLQNTGFGDGILGANNHHIHVQHQAPPPKEKRKVSVSVKKTKSKKKSKKKKKHKKKKDSHSSDSHDDEESNNTEEDMDKFREADDFIIDDVMLNLHAMPETYTDDQDDEHHLDEEEEDELEIGAEDEEEEDEEMESSEAARAWQPRRAVNQDNVYDDLHLHASSSCSTSSSSSSSSPIIHTKRDREGERERERESEREKDDLVDSNDTEIDVNLLPMYQRGVQVQLNKMHYASDQAYEQIMEDISTNGMSQQDIFEKYRIHFIPDETSFKLIPPPSIIARDEYDKVSNDNQLQPTPTPAAMLRRQFEEHDESINVEVIQHRMSANVKSKRAFKNFYALTRMQQKYLSESDTRYTHKKTQRHTQTEDTAASGDIVLSAEDKENMNTLREIHKSAPEDILKVILNDDQLPQWLYEGDTILDLNCGIGDALIYLLRNFTTIRGICIVGTSHVRYKYAKLNAQLHGLADRMEIVYGDLYDPYVRTRFNVSDVIYIDWYNGDDEYLEHYFIADVMNDHYIRSAKPGRVIISYNKMLFDERTFQASYTLHFANDWHVNGMESLYPLQRDAALYLYSVPFYLSKLSNLYVQNFHVFYGYKSAFGYSEDSENAHDEQDGDELHYSDDDDPVSDCHAQSTATHGSTPRVPANAQTYVHFNDPILHRISEMSKDDVANYKISEDELFEVIASVMDVDSDQFEVAEADEIQNVFNVISSQLLYQSFISGVENVMQHTDVTAHDLDTLATILDSINESRETTPTPKTDCDAYDNHTDIQSGAEDEWQYLETNVFSLWNVCTFPHVYDEWMLELNTLLKEFKGIFNEPVTEAAYLRLHSVFADCA